jgi:hypothetical protein
MSEQMIMHVLELLIYSQAINVQQAFGICRINKSLYALRLRLLVRYTLPVSISIDQWLKYNHYIPCRIKSVSIDQNDLDQFGYIHIQPFLGSLKIKEIIRIDQLHCTNLNLTENDLHYIAQLDHWKGFSFQNCHFDCIEPLRTTFKRCKNAIRMIGCVISNELSQRNLCGQTNCKDLQSCLNSCCIGFNIDRFIPEYKDQPIIKSNKSTQCICC